MLLFLKSKLILNNRLIVYNIVYNSVFFTSNVNKSKLAEYAKEASLYATGYYSRRLPHTNFATNSRGILYKKNSRGICFEMFSNSRGILYKKKTAEVLLTK